MKHTLHALFRDTLIMRLILLCLFLALLQGLLLLWKWQVLPPQVPLYYSLPRGEEQLGTPFSLLFLPIFSLGMVLLHSSIAAIIYHHLLLAARLLIITCTIITILLCIALANIIFLVT